jgi:hypothetical protein
VGGAIAATAGVAAGSVGVAGVGGALVGTVGLATSSATATGVGAAIVSTTGFAQGSATVTGTTFKSRISVIEGIGRYSTTIEGFAITPGDIIAAAHYTPDIEGIGISNTVEPE